MKTIHVNFYSCIVRTVIGSVLVFFWMLCLSTTDFAQGHRVPYEGPDTKKQTRETVSPYRLLGKGFFNDSTQDVRQLSIIEKRCKAGFQVGSTDPVEPDVALNNYVDLPVASTQNTLECFPRCVKKGELYFLLHAGGKKLTYEVGSIWNSSQICTVSFEIVGILNGNEVSPPIHTQTLTINKNEPEQLFILDRTNNFEGNPFCSTPGTQTKYETWRVRIKSASIPASVADYIRLECGYKVEYTVAPLTSTDIRLIPNLTHYNTKLGTCATPGLRYTSISPDAIYSNGIKGNPVTLKWDLPPTCNDSFPNYQVQILRLYNIDMSYITNRRPRNENEYIIPGTVDENLNANNDEFVINTTLKWENALTITCGKKREVTLTLPEGRGYYAWRVRPVGNVAEGGIGNPDNLGQWSRVLSDANQNDMFLLNQCVPLSNTVLVNRQSIFFYQGFDNKLNWQYARSFEECKDGGPITSEGVTYSNHIMMPLQSQSKINSDGSTLVSNTVYDYTGRASVTTLPVPIQRAENVLFEQNLILNASGSSPYNSNSVDDAPGTAVTPNVSKYANAEKINSADITSPGGYYSNSNTSESSVPNADGTPFAKAKAGTDGRLIEVGGVGEKHRLGSGKTAKIFYGAVSDEELTTIFGAEAPNRFGVTKQVTLDANGIASATYISKDGHVIATCLLPTKDVLSADPPVSQIDPITQKRYFTNNSFPNSSLMNALNDTINVIGGSEILDNKTHGQISGNNRDISVVKKDLVYAYPCNITVTYTINEYPKFEIPNGGPRCSTYCATCDYKITLRLIKNSTLEVLKTETRTTSLHSNFRNSCNAPTPADFITFSLTIPEAGSYTVERKVEAFNNTLNTQGVSILDEHTARFIGDNAQTRSLEEIMNILFNTPPTPNTLDPNYNHDAFFEDQLNRYKAFWNSLQGAKQISINKPEPNVSACRNINLPPVPDCPSRCENGKPTGFTSWEHYIVEKLKEIYPPDNPTYQWYYKSNKEGSTWKDGSRQVAENTTTDGKIYATAYYFLNSKGEFKFHDEGQTANNGWFNTLIGNMLSCGYECDKVRSALDASIARYIATFQINRNLSYNPAISDDKGLHHPFTMGITSPNNRIYFDLYEDFLDNIGRFNCANTTSYNFNSVTVTNKGTYMVNGHRMILRGTSQADADELRACYDGLATTQNPQPIFPDMTPAFARLVSSCWRSKKVHQDNNGGIKEIFDQNMLADKLNIDFSRSVREELNNWDPKPCVPADDFNCWYKKFEPLSEKCGVRCKKLTDEGSFRKQFIAFARTWTPPLYLVGTKRPDNSTVLAGDNDVLSEQRISCGVDALVADCEAQCDMSDLENATGNFQAKIALLNDWTKRVTNILRGELVLITFNPTNGCSPTFRQVKTKYPNNKLSMFNIAADFLNKKIADEINLMRSTTPIVTTKTINLSNDLCAFLRDRGADPNIDPVLAGQASCLCSLSILQNFVLDYREKITFFVEITKQGSCVMKYKRFKSCYSSSQPHPVVAKLNEFLNQKWGTKFGYQSLENNPDINNWLDNRVLIDGRFGRCSTSVTPTFFNPSGERFGCFTPPMLEKPKFYIWDNPFWTGRRNLAHPLCFTQSFTNSIQPLFKYLGDINQGNNSSLAYKQTGTFGALGTYSYISTADAFSDWTMPSDWNTRRVLNTSIPVYPSISCDGQYSGENNGLLLEYTLNSTHKNSCDIFKTTPSKMAINLDRVLMEALGNTYHSFDMADSRYKMNTIDDQVFQVYDYLDVPVIHTKPRYLGDGWVYNNTFNGCTTRSREEKGRYDYHNFYLINKNLAPIRQSIIGGGNSYQLLRDVSIFHTRRATQTATDGDWYSFGTLLSVFDINFGEMFGESKGEKPKTFIKGKSASNQAYAFVHAVKLVPKIVGGAVVGVTLKQSYRMKGFTGTDIDYSDFKDNNMIWVEKDYDNPEPNTNNPDPDVTSVIDYFLTPQIAPWTNGQATTFTSKIGYFSQDNQGYLVYNDVANNEQYTFIRYGNPEDGISINAAVRFADEETITLNVPCCSGCPLMPSCDAFCLKYEDKTRDIVKKIEDIDIDKRDYIVSYPEPTCASINVLRIKDQIRQQYESIMRELGRQIKGAYTSKCNAAELQDELKIQDVTFAHHYTLYYYDRAGNLVKTVPPRGVDIPAPSDVARLADLRQRKIVPSHTLATENVYNSFGQLISNKTPDGGETWYGYNKLGQLRITQTQYQRSVNRYSYIDYDYLGRAKETGEAGTAELSSYSNTDPLSLERSIFDVSDGRSIGTPHSNKSTVSSIRYTTPVLTMPSGYGPFEARPTVQRGLRNRVSSTEYDADGNPTTDDDRPSTIYSYDEHGNTEWLIRNIPIVKAPGTGGATPLLSAKIEYDYDLISGNVNMVRYRSGFKDRFFRKFEYDADNRLSAVFSSRDSILWEQDVRYSYYQHGPLRRAVIGEDSLQGRDYVYTLHGWLKAINHTAAVNGVADFDPGKDGASLGLERTKVAKDAFAEILNYYDADYESASGVYNSSHSTAKPTGATELFDGNISAVSSRTQASGDNNLRHDGTPTADVYRYDVVGRLRTDGFLTAQIMGTGTNTGYTWQGNSIQEYNSSYEYDENGNLQALNRNGYPLGGEVSMDKITYNYGARVDNGNRLQSVSDAGTTSYPPAVKDIRGTQASQNYVYDVQGRLIEDTQENLKYSWLPSGKIGEVKKNNVVLVKFLYDAEGNRVRKTMYAPNGNITGSTYYVYGEDGSVSAIYKQVGTGDVYLAEVPLYGAGRLGMMLFAPGPETQHCPSCTTSNNFTTGVIATRRVGAKLYELTDHLGNVRAVIGDVKLAEGGSFKVDLKSYTNYYPYGMEQPQRTWTSTLSGAEGYRYGYNGVEEDDELKGEGNSLSTYYRLYDPRLALWLGIDPVVHESESPYASMGGNPILYSDPMGDDTSITSEIRDPNKNPAMKNLQSLGTVNYNGQQIGYSENRWWGVRSTSDVVVTAERSGDGNSNSGNTSENGISWWGVFKEALVGGASEEGSATQKTVQELNKMTPKQRMDNFQNSPQVGSIDKIQQILVYVVTSRMGRPIWIPAPSTMARTYVDPDNLENQVKFVEEMQTTQQSIVRIPGKKNSESAPKEKPEQQTQQNGGETIRIGQWMSPTELKEFSRTGVIPRSHGLVNGKEGWERQASKGDHYVEFDVNANIITKADQNGWVTIKPNSELHKKAAVINGQQLPPAVGKNIKKVDTKE